MESIGPFCSCCRVVSSPRKHKDGTFSDRWACDSCGREFAPLGTVRVMTMAGVVVQKLLDCHHPEGKDCRCRKIARRWMYSRRGAKKAKGEE